LKSQVGRVMFLLALVLAATSNYASPADGVLEGPLSVNGTSIVNPVGRVVLLRGANYPGYELAPFPSTHSESAYELFARAGFNVVRLPISWSNLEPIPGTFQESYLEFYVDRDIRWAKKYGIYLVLDMTQYNWATKFGGVGAPEWAVNQYPPTEVGMRRAVSDFWNQTDLQDHLATAWRKIAERYANETTVAGYDLLNEPWIYTSIIPTLNVSHVNSFYVRVINSIRTVDPNHIIFLEPSNMPPTEFPITYNIVWSPHFYALSFEPFYNQRSVGILEADLAEKYQTFVVEMKQPMWIGEFGAFMKDDSAHDWLRDAISVFRKYQVGWAWWAFYGRNLVIPNQLHVTWATEHPPPVTEPAGLTLNLDAVLTGVVLVEVVLIATILYSMLDRRGEMEDTARGPVRRKRRPGAFPKH